MFQIIDYTDREKSASASEAGVRGQTNELQIGIHSSLPDVPHQRDSVKSKPAIVVLSQVFIFVAKHRKMPDERGQ